MTAFNNAISPIIAGPFGVALFFLISGFVIPFSFVRLSRIEFLIARFFRIWPTYFVGFIACILIVAITVLAGGGAWPFPIARILAHAVVGGREVFSIPTMDGVVWTLEVEARFYLLAAILGPVLLRGSNLAFLVPVLLLAAAIVFAIMRQWFGWMDRGLANEFFTYTPYLIFMYAGVALNFYHRGRQPALQSAIAVGLIAASAWLALRLLSANYALIAPSYFAALMVFIAAMLAGDRVRWDWAPLVFLAEISFSLYVVHALTGFVVMNTLLVKLSISPYAAPPIAFAAAIVAAAILNRTIERPSQRLGKAMARRRSKSTSRLALAR